MLLVRSREIKGALRVCGRGSLVWVYIVLKREE
jgi:hypothetical protein